MGDLGSDLFNAVQDKSGDDAWSAASTAGMDALQAEPVQGGDITTGGGGALTEMLDAQAMSSLFGGRFDDGASPPGTPDGRLLKPLDPNVMHGQPRNRDGMPVNEDGSPLR